MRDRACAAIALSLAAAASAQAVQGHGCVDVPPRGAAGPIEQQISPNPTESATDRRQPVGFAADILKAKTVVEARRSKLVSYTAEAVSGAGPIPVTFEAD